MPEENLADLPEALPLKRVSPAWRVLTFLGAAGILLLLFAVGSLVLLVLRQGRELAAARMGILYNAPSAAPTITVPIIGGDPGAGVPGNGANLPYPVQEDLRPPRADPQAEAPDPANSARARFLAKGREFWKAPAGQSVQELAVSPDGQSIAYFKDNQLVAGTFANPLLVEEAEAPAPPTTRPARGVGMPAPGPIRQPVSNGPETRLIGLPTWSADSQYVYFARLDGRIQRYDTQAKNLTTMPFRGGQPVPLPGDSQRVVFVRSQSVPKTDAPGAPSTTDPTEIVICPSSVEPRDAAQRSTVVVPARALEYSYPAVSGDGRWLALWAQPPHSEDARVLRVDLTKAGAEPEWLDIPANQAPGPLCWTKDGKQLIYARWQTQPLPPDCWASFRSTSVHNVDLFQWDLAAKTENRLSRGGGFVSPSLDRDGGLFYLTETTGFPRNERLRRVPLATAIAFAAAEPTLPARDRAAWTELIDQIWQESKAPADPKAPLTAELMARLATGLQRRFPQRFKEALPPGPTGLDRLELETASLLPPEAERRWKLILTAARGEFLCKTHGAVWHLVPEPAPEDRRRVFANQNSFALVVNLLDMQHQLFADREDGQGAAVETLLRQAEGRTLVLTNDSQAGQEAAAKLVDPDLASGADLLKQGKTQEGEKLLDELVKKPEHQRNYHLGLAVGQLLYSHKRFEALQRLMEGQCIQQPADARKFNLLGLALLERQPREAAGAFKKALRCDLSYGPGYLNLAQAYRLGNDTPSAVACLRRYLEVEPFGPQAADAARRLATLEAEAR